MFAKKTEVYRLENRQENKGNFGPVMLRSCRTDFTEAEPRFSIALVSRCSIYSRRGTLRPRESRPFALGIDPAADVA
jgi:hypothetical protein